MTPRTWRCGLVLMVVTSAVTAAAQDPQPPLFRARTTAVSLDVSVKRGNRPVTGLTAGDFELTDNGVPQKVERALIDAVPIDVTLIIDASGSTASVFDGIRRNGQRILELLRPGDRTRVLVIETTPYELLPLRTVDERLVLPEHRLPGNWSSIHDAILTALVTQPDADRRRLVAAITDGADTKSVTSVQSLEAVARRSDTVLHVISVLPSPADPGRVPPRRTTSFGFVRGEPTRDERERFERLPALTGGTFHGPGHDSRWGINVNVVAAVRDLIDEFRQSYVIQYRPQNVSPGGWHDVVVGVKGVDPRGVRTRAGYFDPER